jgi:hypothetical protein
VAGGGGGGMVVVTTKTVAWWWRRWEDLDEKIFYFYFLGNVGRASILTHDNVLIHLKIVCRALF